MFIRLQAGIDRRDSTNAVDINGKFKINATSNDIENSKRLMVLLYIML